MQRMEHRRIAKKIRTYSPKRRQNIGRPQLRCKGISVLFERTEQVTYGLIHEDDDANVNLTVAFYCDDTKARLRF
jgi:hypothetical protein